MYYVYCEKSEDRTIIKHIYYTTQIIRVYITSFVDNPHIAYKNTRFLVVVWSSPSWSYLDSSSSLSILERFLSCFAPRDLILFDASVLNIRTTERNSYGYELGI